MRVCLSLFFLFYRNPLSVISYLYLSYRLCDFRINIILFVRYISLSIFFDVFDNRKFCFLLLQINALNDSHQQLMVHWVGEGSNVIICLARDSTPVLRYLGGRFSFPTQPSAVYISYDYGDTFENKTDQFRVSSDPDALYAVVDKFTNHPKYYQHVSSVLQKHFLQNKWSVYFLAHLQFCYFEECLRDFPFFCSASL